VSVYISMRVEADAGRFKQVTEENKEKFLAIAERAKQQGCIHHTFGTSNGEVIVIDEWESPEAFEKFFESEDDIRELMSKAGITAEPEFGYYRPMNLGDEF
jgi:hypothetical protein